MKATALDQTFGVIPPDIAARLDGDENMPVVDYFREPTFDELIAHHVEYIESWDEFDAAQPDVMWSIHMSLVTMSAVESKCSTQGRIKMHHLGRLFSRWIWVVVARVKS